MGGLRQIKESIEWCQPLIEGDLASHMYSGFMSIRSCSCIAVLMLSGCFWCSITQGAEDAVAAWRVVILHSSDVALPASVLLA